MSLIDANVVLRYLLDDHAELSQRNVSVQTPCFKLPLPLGEGWGEGTE